MIRQRGLSHACHVRKLHPDQGRFSLLLCMRPLFSDKERWFIHHSHSAIQIRGIQSVSTIQKSRPVLQLAVYGDTTRLFRPLRSPLISKFNSISIRNFSQEELNDAIAKFSHARRKDRSKLTRRLALGSVVFAIISYMAYRVYIQDETMFIPFWLKPYVLEDVLSKQQLSSLRVLTVDALLEAIAYQESIAAVVGLPIIVESLNDIHFSFPPGRPAEHVLKGLEIYRATATQILPNIRQSIRIFSSEDIKSSITSPLFDAVGLFSENLDEPVQEILESIERKSDLWVEVVGSAIIEGSKTRKENSETKSLLPAMRCVVKFKGYMDLERMNSVRIQTGELIVFRGDEEIKKFVW